MSPAVRRVLRPLASLRLTVVLLALAMGLIFAGTLAQATLGVWQVIDGYFRSPIAWIDLQLFVPRQIAEVPGRAPFPGGFVIAGLLIVNLLAAHLVRFRLTRRRIGIVVLHAGLIVLLAGEFVTAAFADEGLMSIDEGGSASYVEDAREVELAVVEADPEDGSAAVVAVPEAMLAGAARRGEAIEHAALPFAVRVEDWAANSRLRRTDAPTPATRGIGTGVAVERLPRVSGAEVGRVDAPSAHVTLLDGEDVLGTWLVSVNLAAPQRVEIGGRAYEIGLRFRRTYKPYTLHLIEFRHDRFVGTEVPRNFSSRVRLVDPSRGVDREALIWMNNPLRYAGETFYQASYKPDDSGTVLQVVRNPGWLMPYVACAMVGGGLLLHFGMSLTGFLRRSGAGRRRAGAGGAAGRGGAAEAALPWAVGVLGVVIGFSGLLRPAPRGEFDLGGFARLPASEGGRVKPMDSVARNAVLIASGRRSVAKEGERAPAVEAMLDLIARPGDAQALPLVRVDHPDVLALLDRTPEQAGRLSLAEIEPHWPKVLQQAQRAGEAAPKARDPFQRAVLGLYEKVDRLLVLARMEAPYAVPPLAPGEEWRPFSEALLDSPLAAGLSPHAPEGAAPADPGGVHPGVAYTVAMMTAYSEGDPDRFNAAVAGYRAVLDRAMPGVMRRADLEVLFNRASPFMGAMAVYVLSFLLTCGALLLRLQGVGDGAARGAGLAEHLRRSATALLWAALVVHTVGIVFRVYLQGRPPVTNLYSSAVFVGWAAVLLGAWMERLFPLGVAALGSAAVGFATLIVAHNLGQDGDTMQMMQAVLDSNFWLATHVITITLGYSANFLAGMLAVVCLLLGVTTRRLSREGARALSKMVYGTVCFALLLSFVGTVLGGIWADQSWGRFWGWDPKENGAALVVLINAIILHARWGGLVRDRGVMVLAVSGNIVTAWSWFGTNMLGVGLHAYGFIDSAVFWLIAFVISQFAVMGLGLLPRSVWRSGAA